MIQYQILQTNIIRIVKKTVGRIGNEILRVKGLTYWVKYVKCQVTASSFPDRSYSLSMFDSQAKLLFRVDTKPHHPDRVSTQFTDVTTSQFVSWMFKLKSLIWMHFIQNKDTKINRQLFLKFNSYGDENF